MFISDLKSALRNIIRNRITSLISILGLGIGLGCIIILMALIIHEKSFDRYIPGHRNVYRVLLGNFVQTPYPLAEAMSADVPEIQGFFRYYRANPLQLRTKQNEIIRESSFAFADTSIYRILGIDFLSGSPAASPAEVAISREAALRYFGDISPVGLSLPVKMGEGFIPLTVSGVYEDFPANSTLYPSLIADIKLSGKMFTQWQRALGEFGSTISGTPDWTHLNYLTYVVLSTNSDPETVAAKLGKYKEFFTLEDRDELQFRLQPVTRIYLDSEELSATYYVRQGNRSELIYYEVISLLILIISLANYILLTRAGVVERVLNLGTRKAFGASHGKIRRLIIFESLSIVLFSLIPASFIIDFGIELVNTSLNKTLSTGIFLNPLLWVSIIAVVLLTGTLAGWLIGFYYSRIPALDLISGRTGNNGRRGSMNYSFLVLHFAIYMIFASGIMTISKQIDYSMSEYHGMNPEQVLVAELPSDNLMRSFATLKSEMERVPGVLQVSGGSFIPPLGNLLPITLADADGSKIRFDGLIMGEGLTELLGIELIDGETFGVYKDGIPEVLINETAAKTHKVKAGDRLLAFRVKGVVRDFAAHSMHTAIQDLVILQQNPVRMTQFVIRTDGKNDESVKERLRQVFNQISPDEIFETEYLTDRIESFYQRERRQAKIVGAFGILAAVLSVMGLFGISVISIARRRKEIGLRKVNGAATREVLLMVNVDFLKWVLVAFMIAVPASIFLLNKWLERFAFKTGLSWWIFAVAGLSAILIAILTVSWQSLRAATSNPVEAIRYE